MNVLYFFPSCVWIDQVKFDKKELIKSVKDFSKNNKSIDVSNVGGYQYDNYKDQKLSAQIISRIPRVQKNKFINPTIYMWLNVNSKGDSNIRHTHFNSSILLSGVFYVKVPPNSGNIRFYDPRGISIHNPPDNRYYFDGSEYNYITPKEGMLLFFPSWFEHSVEENKSDEERMSIGFNIFVEHINNQKV